jgi:hypothetical protein
VFILEGLSFILIGLELRPALAGLADRAIGDLLTAAVLIAAVVIVVRIAWVFAATLLSRVLGRDPYPGWRPTAVVAWAGMRGVVSMAAALALPALFPQRELLIFLTFVVIFVTLVAQGLTLPTLIRRLEVVEPADRTAVEEAETRARIAQAALERLEELEHDLDLPDDDLEHLRRRHQHSIDHHQARRGGDHDRLDQTLAEVRRELLEAERAELLRLRDEQGISPEVFRRVLRDLDVEQTRLDR